MKQVIDMNDYISPLYRDNLTYKWYEVIFNFIKKIFGYCEIHGWFMYPKKFRANTSYENDSLNFEVGCKFCKEESDEYWNSMWEDYNSSRG